MSEVSDLLSRDPESLNANERTRIITYMRDAAIKFAAQEVEKKRKNAEKGNDGTKAAAFLASDA